VLQQALLFTLIPLAAAVASGVVASFWTPSPAARSYIQHFAAGIVLAAVIGELLSDVVSRQVHVPAVVVGFALGLFLMLGIKLVSHAGGGHGGGASLIATAAVDTLVDGFVIGLGFVVGGGTGALLAVALAIELFFLGLSASASVGESGRSGRWKLAVGVGLGVLVVIGSVAGVLLLGGRGDGGAGVRVHRAPVPGDGGAAGGGAQRARDAVAHARALHRLYPGIRDRDAGALSWLQAQRR